MRVAILLGLLPLLVVMQGCTSWQRRPFAPGETQVRTDRPLRILLTNGTQVTLDRARTVGDSLIGDIERTDIRYAVALGDISRLEHKRISFARTAGLPLAVLGSMILVSTVLLVLAAGVGSRV